MKINNNYYCLFEIPVIMKKLKIKYNKNNYISRYLEFNKEIILKNKYNLYNKVKYFYEIRNIWETCLNDNSNNRM